MRTLKALAVAAATVLPAAAMAQQTSPSAGAAQTPPPAPTVLPEQKAGEVLSNSYIGADVVARSTDGLEKVGTVSELVLDDQAKIVGVVVDVGGFLGVGAKPVGLAWGALTEEQAEGELLLKTSLTRQDLEDAPEFKTLTDTQVESDQQMMEQGTEVPTAPAQ